MHYIEEILNKYSLLPKEKIQDLAATAKNRDIDLLELVQTNRQLDQNAFSKALAKEAGVDIIDSINVQEVPSELIERIPINYARQQHILPIIDKKEYVLTALGNPLDLEIADDLRALLSRSIKIVGANFDTIDHAINQVYERKEDAHLGDKEDNTEETLEDLLDANDEAPVIRFVNNLFYTSIRERASDIHIEPLDDRIIVRFRIDGKLVQRKEAPKGALASIVARLKIEAGLNIAEKRLPQDGRITKKVAGKVVDVRVSTIPTARGESVVMRLLDKESIQLSLTDLGFAKQEHDAWLQLINKPNGILLITGPTGSGKTTTLYASLNQINTPDKKILTAENPVEYELPGINQLQVHSKIGLTFASALRAFLRQDPDVIMVGEIRDKETAELAIQASLTGHLVLSTLHTNDAPSAINRLIDMDVQPFQISSTLLGVLAQRLVRKLCPLCKKGYEPNQENVMALGLGQDKYSNKIKELQEAAKSTVLGEGSLVLNKENVLNSLSLGSDIYGSYANINFDRNKLTFYRPIGCSECSNTGYRGRIGIVELMAMTPELRAMIPKKPDSKTVASILQKRGIRLLRDDGARQVIAGVTSLEEVMAATQSKEGEELG